MHFFYISRLLLGSDDPNPECQAKAAPHLYVFPYGNGQISRKTSHWTCGVHPDRLLVHAR